MCQPDASKKTVINRKCVLTQRPGESFDATTDCELRNETIAMDDLQDNEVLVRVDAIGIDAFIRVMLDESEEHGEKNRVHGGIELGDVIPANAIGTVVQSSSKKFPIGKSVTGLFGAQTHARVKADGLMSMMKIPRVPEHKFLNLFSVSGLTAYVGVNRVVKAPGKGETAVISAAAGATGSIAAQLAQRNGARVIGIAGGAHKSQFLVEDLGLDGAIDYKHPTKSLKEQFEEQCPDGIDFFYDNVGGDCLNEALGHLAKHGRVVLCGAVSQYGKKEKQGPSNYIRLAEQSGTMAGFVVLHYPMGMLLAFLNLVWLFFRNKIRSFEQVHEGIDEFPNALQKLYEGGNIGKPVVNLTTGTKE